MSLHSDEVMKDEFNNSKHEVEKFRERWHTVVERFHDRFYGVFREVQERKTDREA